MRYVAARFYRTSDREPTIMLAGLPIPLHPDVSDEVGEAIAAQINAQLERAHAYGAELTRSSIRKVLGVSP